MPCILIVIIETQNISPRLEKPGGSHTGTPIDTNKLFNRKLYPVRVACQDHVYRHRCHSIYEVEVLIAR